MKLIRYKKWKFSKSDFGLAYLIFILFYHYLYGINGYVNGS